MEKGAGNFSTNSLTIPSQSDAGGKLIIKSQTNDSDGAQKSTHGSLILNPHTNTTIDQNIIFPENIGTAGTLLSINSINSNTAILKWNDSINIADNGNIGIGTNTPSTLLELSGNEPYLTLTNTTEENTDGGAETKIIFNDHSETSLAQIQASHDGTSDDTKGDLIFSTNDGTSINEALRIDSSGNIGIDKTDPSYKLHLHGDSFFDGNVTISGTAIFNGDTTIVNSTELEVTDKNILVGKSEIPSNNTARGGGITLQGGSGGDKTIIWSDSSNDLNNNWNFSENVNIADSKTYKINNTYVLSSTTLGGSVVNSSLTQVGALNSGSITSGFGSIDVGSSTITTTGTITGGTIEGNVTGDITGDVIGNVTGNLTGNVTGNVTGQVSDISNHNTGHLAEGSNLYYTLTRSRGAISVTDSGGDGSLSYNNTDGVITYTGPSATETRAHFSGGTGVTINNGAIAIGQSVGTTDNVAFNQVNSNLIIGNVNGDVTGDITGNVSGDVSGNVTGNLTGNVTGNVTGNLTGNVTGNLTGDVTGNLTGNVTGNLTGDVTGNAATATILETSRTIGGVSFDGSANIDLPGVNTPGQQNTSGNAATATILETSRTIGGVSFDGSANIDLPGVNTPGVQNTSGNAATATILETSRTIGGVSFDGSANIDLPGVNTSGNQDTSGNASTAAALQTSRTIGGVSFDGSADINLPGVNIAGNQNTSGNAATATELQTSRTIGGVSFDGSADINLPGVDTTGNQDTSGNAATATTLQTARTIGGVSFNGSTNINLPGVNTTGNQDTTGNAASATVLQTARTIGGVSFNGSTNIDLPGVNTTGNQDTTGNAASATVLQTARTIGGVSFDGSANIDLQYISGLTEGSLIDIIHTPSSNSNATIAVDLSEATDKTTIVDGDYIVMLDGGSSGTNAKTSISNISNLFAGTGLTSTNSVLNIDSSQTQITSLGTLTSLSVDNLNMDGNTISSTYTNGDITIDTNGTGNTIIQSNVGIGTTNPSSKLHLHNTNSDTSILFDAFRVSNSGNSSNFVIQKVHKNNGFDFNTCLFGHGIEIDSSYYDINGSDGKFLIRSDGTSAIGGSIVIENGELSLYAYNQSSNSDQNVLSSAVSNITLFPTGDVSIGHKISGVAKLDVNGSILSRGVSNASGKLILNDSSNNNNISLQLPASALSSSYTLTLPATAGTVNQVLQTNGSGTLSWVDQTSAISNLSDIGDVSTTEPSSGQVLIYNGSEWEPGNNSSLSGLTATETELNVLDGDTTATATTIVDSDRVVLNDSGTMKQVAVTDLRNYLDDAIVNMPNLTGVGTLTSLSVDNLNMDGNTISSTNTNGDITIDTNGTGNTIIQSNVGIGTTSPDEKLEVNGNVKIETTSDATLNIIAHDDNIASINLYGNATQGTGRVYVGQSMLYGGGFLYDGNNNPSIVGNTDYVTFFRRNDGGEAAVFGYPYSNNNVYFYGDINVNGKINLSEISTPSQPSDGNGVLYTKAGGLPYWRSYDINETALIENGRQFAFYATPVSTAHFLSGSQSYNYYRYASQTKFTIGLVENSSQFFDLNSVIYTVPMDGNYTFGWTTAKLGHSSGSRLIIRVYRNGSYSNLVDSGYSTTGSIRHTVYTGNLLRNDQISWWVLGSGGTRGGSESGLYMASTTGISTGHYSIFYGYKN